MQLAFVSVLSIWIDERAEECSRSKKALLSVQDEPNRPRASWYRRYERNKRHLATAASGSCCILGSRVPSTTSWLQFLFCIHTLHQNNIELYIYSLKVYAKFSSYSKPVHMHVPLHSLYRSSWNINSFQVRFPLIPSTVIRKFVVSWNSGRMQFSEWYRKFL